MTDVKDCLHETLQFGASGFYIFCNVPGCRVVWVATTESDPEKEDHDRGKGPNIKGLRIKPEADHPRGKR